MSFIELENSFGTKVVLCSVGASMYDIRTLDRNGKEGSIVITPLDREKFPKAGSFFGKTIGRTGGRIAGGEFTIDGIDYKIPSWDPNGLHGGDETLAMQDFSYKLDEDEASYICEFSYLSKHLESGYPGNLTVKVTYRLYKKENKLSCNYYATTDKDTLLNLSNHAYFNLDAESGRDALGHDLYIKASKMERIEKLLPREIIDCKGIYSFAIPHRVGDFLFDKEIIENTNGYDFPYILDETGLDKKNVVLSDSVTGRTLTVSTTYPVVVMYTCNYSEDVIVKSNRVMKPYDAVCLEAMYHPNTFKSDFLKDKKDLLKKGDVYDETICYIFGIIE